MIEIRVKKSQKQYIAVGVTGHAEYDEHGKDIVCASVSILAQTLLASLGNLSGIEDIDYSIESGDLAFELPVGLNHNQTYNSNLLIESFLIGINGILEIYPDYLDLQVEEVLTDDDQI
jgi:uncharacterized protein YsxB (DUF464 family)